MLFPLSPPDWVKNPREIILKKIFKFVEYRIFFSKLAQNLFQTKGNKNVCTNKSVAHK